MEVKNAPKASKKFLFQSLQGRILIPGILLALVPAILIAVISIQKASSGLDEQMRLKLETAASKDASSTKSEMTYYLSAIASMSGSLRLLTGGAVPDSATLATITKSTQTFASDIKEISVLSPDGETLASSSGSKLSLGDQDFFRSALAGVPSISDPVLTSDGDEMVYMAAPMVSNGTATQVIVAGMSLKSYYENRVLADKTGLGSGYPYIVDKNGVLIGHPETAKLTKENLTQDPNAGLAAASVAMTKGQSGTARYTYEGVDNVVSYKPIGINGWSIAVTEPASEALSSVNSLKQTIIITLVIVALIAALAAFWAARNIAGPMDFLAKRAEDFAEGGVGDQFDAAQKQKLARRGDEIGVLGRSFLKMEAGLNDMANVATQIANADLSVNVQPRSDRDVLGNAILKAVKSLNVLFSKLNETAHNLAAAKDQLAQSADQASQATQQVAQTASEVAGSTGQQAAATQEVGQALEQLSRAIEQVVEDAEAQTRQVAAASSLSEKVSVCGDTVSDAAQKALERSRRAGETSREGAEMVQKAIDGMERIRSAVEGASGEISHLGERSTEIGKIIAVIDDIAAQTNLLALNAAIEAARAGEQGRGFAVVADEVRKLAERVATATKEIGELIAGIQQGVEGTVKAMEQGSIETSEGAKLAAEAGESLRQILTVVEEMNNEIADIAASSEELKSAGAEMYGTMEQTQKLVEKSMAASEEMRANANQVIEGVSGIAAIAEENSAATQEVSASAEEMSAQVQEVTAATHSLGEMAEELRSGVSNFTLRVRSTRLAEVPRPEGEEESRLSESSAA
jgi:methyl-accepting chemotaxis protein